MKKTSLSIVTASLLAAVVSATPPTTAPTTGPATAPATAPVAGANNRALVLNGVGQIGIANNILEAQRRSVAIQKQSLESQSVVATYRLDDLVKFSLVDGFLRADVACGDLPPGQSRFSVEGSDCMWAARCMPNAGFPMGRFVNLSRYDFDQVNEGQTWHTFLNCSDVNFTLNATGVGFTLSYHQSNGMVMLTAMKMENGRYRQFLRADAPNLLRLQAEHPEEVRQYLVPLLRRWTNQEVLNPGPTDVYTVFGELTPPSDAAAKVTALLPQLDSEVFADRDAASKALANLGRAGVQAALRLDRGALTFEQNDRIDAFIEHHRHRLADDSKALRRDADFLMDCLEDEDLAVRLAARAELEKVLGRAVKFDTSAAAAKRIAAVDELRKALRDERAAKATTQPG